MSTDVTLDRWGRAVLEEALYLAAGSVGSDGASTGTQLSVSVAITVAPAADDGLSLVIESAIEGPIRTVLRRPF